MPIPSPFITNALPPMPQAKPLAMLRPSPRKLSPHEQTERQIGPDNLAASYWYERLVEYQPAYTDLAALVTVLMRIEPKFRHALAYNQLREALKGKGRIKDVDLLRLTVETIRRHLAANPTVEKDYKTQLRGKNKGFTGKAASAETDDELDIQVLRARTTRHTRQCNPATQTAQQP